VVLIGLWFLVGGVSLDFVVVVVGAVVEVLFRGVSVCGGFMMWCWQFQLFFCYCLALCKKGMNTKFSIFPFFQQGAKKLLALKKNTRWLMISIVAQRIKEAYEISKVISVPDFQSYKLFCLFYRFVFMFP